MDPPQKGRTMYSFDDTLMRTADVSIPVAEYEALTLLEAQVRRMAAKRAPVDRGVLSALLEKIRYSRSLAY